MFLFLSLFTNCFFRKSVGHPLSIKLLCFIAIALSKVLYLCYMELVVKLYADKISGLAIKYDTEYRAQKAYEELLQTLAEGPLDLVFEMRKGQLELLLQSQQNGKSILHKTLDYKVDQLKRLQNIYKPGFQIQYLHVFSKQNTLFVAKPFRKAQFMKIAGIRFFPSHAAQTG